MEVSPALAPSDSSTVSTVQVDTVDGVDIMNLGPCTAKKTQYGKQPPPASPAGGYFLFGQFTSLHISAGTSAYRCES